LQVIAEGRQSLVGEGPHVWILPLVRLFIEAGNVADVVGHHGFHIMAVELSAMKLGKFLKGLLVLFVQLSGNGNSLLLWQEWSAASPGTNSSIRPISQVGVVSGAVQVRCEIARRPSGASPAGLMRVIPVSIVHVIFRECRFNQPGSVCAFYALKRYFG